MPKLLYALLAVALFVFGAYVFKVKNTGQPLALDQIEAPPPQVFQPTAVLVEVGGEKVTQEDIDWEYALLTDGLEDKDQLTPIPDLGPKYSEEMASLRKSLVSNVVERKVLYQYLQQDRDFGFDDPKRYMSCMTEWQEGVKAESKALLQKGGKERLKARLCERSILDQYMSERLFSKIKLEEREVVEYYKNHQNEFKLQERVRIRQILLGDEDEAKRVRARTTAHNFEEMAKENSLSPEAERGGLLGPFAKGAMPAVFEFAFHMREGEVSEVLKSNYGFHIIMLLDKYPKKDLSLDEARPRISQILKKKREEEEYRKWVEQALAAISVTSPKPVW